MHEYSRDSLSAENLTRENLIGENADYALQPKMPNELFIATEEAAQEHAKNYKLALADQLMPKNRLFQKPSSNAPETYS